MRAARLAVLLVLAAGALAAAERLDERAARHRRPAPPTGIGALRICTGCARAGDGLARYGYVILNSWDAPLIRRLKAANPGLKALVYENLSFTVDYTCKGGVDDVHRTAGVGYCDAARRHAGWFALDSAGRRLASWAFPSSWLMDVGDAGYRRRWLANVTRELRAGAWDGVFADDVDADLGYHLHGRAAARYPTAGAWQRATRGMLAVVGPALRSRGFLVVPNVYDPPSREYDALAVWRDWLRFTSGAAQEYFAKSGTGTAGRLTGAEWTFRQRFQRVTEAAGKIFIGITYAPRSDERSMLYARATFLLNTVGGRSALVYEPGSGGGSRDPYAAPWTASVGRPLGPRRRVGRAWLRAFTGGAVVVNPSATGVTVPLGRAYLDAGGDLVSSVTLAPATGAILRSSVPAPASSG